MGKADLKGKLGLTLMGGALLSKSLIQFSVDGWSCVPSLLFTWGQTMVEVMKIMVTSFKRSHAYTATLSAPSPAAGHHWPTPLLETPGHLQASLGQSLVGSLLLSPGSWCTRFCFCPPRVYFPVLCKSWQFYGGVNGDLLQSWCHTKAAAPRAPARAAAHCWPVPPQETFKHSSVSVSLRSLGPGAHKVCLWAFLLGIGFDSKCEFAPPTILLGLLLCPWTQGICPSLTFYWGFSDLGPGVSAHGHSPRYSAAWPPLQH